MKYRYTTALIASSLLFISTMPFAHCAVVQGRITDSTVSKPRIGQIKPITIPKPAVPINGRFEAGHLLRRIGFGPVPTDLNRILKLGLKNYISQQLSPEVIDDSAADALVAQVPPDLPANNNILPYARRWYIRMAYSKRQ